MKIESLAAAPATGVLAGKTKALPACNRLGKEDAVAPQFAC